MADSISTDEAFVSVMMPVYNGSKYIREAIDSVISQTHENWELIIVDDCSQDNTVEIIKRYTDPRIILLQNKTNSRTAVSLNKAIDKAKGKYLARMDQDDINYPNRFMKQVEFLDANPECGVCGTHIRDFGENIEESYPSFPLTHEELQLRNLYCSALVHPTVMIRKSVLDEHDISYREGVIAEDYSLWIKLLLVTKAANLKDVLMHHRIHGSSITKTLYKTIMDQRPKMRLEYCINLLGKEHEFWAKVLYSKSNTLRRIAIHYFIANQNRFDAKLFRTYIERLNQHLKFSTGWRWYMRRIKSKVINMIWSAF